MVMTSNWPPFVPTSVVRRWRRTFSSSVTHRRCTPGLAFSNSPESLCMTIMSELLTVAIVKVVSACATAAVARQPASAQAIRPIQLICFLHVF